MGWGVGGGGLNSSFSLLRCQLDSINAVISVRRPRRSAGRVNTIHHRRNACCLNVPVSLIVLPRWTKKDRKKTQHKRFFSFFVKSDGGGRGNGLRLKVCSLF